MQPVPAVQRVRGLDVVIIGAQKAGTTTLFKYLAEHPQLYMLPEKEAPFFSRPEYETKGWEWFIEEYFGAAPPDRMWGKATPQYMCDPRVPTRLHATLPDARLIAILRDPVSRAVSHYRMLVRRGIETRPFEVAVQAHLDPTHLAHARTLPAGASSEPACVLVWGEYGRILEAYRAVFPQQQLHVCFMEDLARHPLRVFHEVCRFLEIDDTCIPSSLGQRYHQGGLRQRWPGLRRFFRQEAVRNLWHRVPGRYRRPLTYWFQQWNTVPSSDESVPLPAPLQQTLVDFFRPDVARLKHLIQQPIPWPSYE
jgi:hypothetical protein